MTLMQESVCHLDASNMCRELHNMHRETLHWTWNFKPLCIDLEKPDDKPVSFVYLEERLCLFREGNTYRMAYGSKPIEAYAIAFAERAVGGRPARDEQMATKCASRKTARKKIAKMIKRTCQSSRNYDTIFGVRAR